MMHEAGGLRAFPIIGGILVLSHLVGFLNPTAAHALSRGDRILDIGDTLTVIQRPLVNIPTLVRPGDTLTVQCEADPSTTGWTVWLSRGNTQVYLPVLSSAYDASTLWWEISAEIPPVSLYDLYDLWVSADGGIIDETRNAVRLISEFKTDYYFIQITDSHLPTHLYNYQSGADTDSSEVIDLREVMEDIDVLNPEFVLFTGDLINEGELEDYLGWRVYTRTQALLTECEIPMFVTSGNHDIGGWDDTPPSDGTARRDWWRFFGWKRLDAPPPGAPWYTQNYSFDYGPVHFTGLEAYNNYDNWRSYIYGSDSFTSGQLDWLDDDLDAAASSAAQVLFYHRDFQSQISLSSLDVEMALSGHIHRDEGNIHSQPYDLVTNNICDGERAYRVIYVSNGVLQPTNTVSSGSSGQNFRVDYSPANDGTDYEVTAQITNNHNLDFEHGLLRFLMPEDAGNPQVTGGTLLQVDDSSSPHVYYVGVNIQADDTQSVTLTVSPVSLVADVADVARGDVEFAQNHPNPFNPATTLRYILPGRGHARLAIFDIRGREIAVLVDGLQTAGEHAVEWNGLSGRGYAVPSGVYLARLEAAGEVRTRKIVLAR